MYGLYRKFKIIGSINVLNTMNNYVPTIWFRIMTTYLKIVTNYNIIMFINISYMVYINVSNKNKNKNLLVEPEYWNLTNTIFI